MEVSLEARLANRTLVHGTGVALGDVDGDGWVDVYLCMLGESNVLYRNLGGMRFEDVTIGSGAALGDRVSRGAAFADADGDGDLDLFVAVHGGRNTLLLNDGTGSFEEVEAGFEGEWGSGTVTVADVDGDGDLDVYFANYKTIQGDDLFSPEARSLRGVVQRIGDSIAVEPPWDEHYRMVLEGDLVRRFELADPDEFYLNQGDGRFQKVEFDSGYFLSEDGSALTGPPRDWGLTARFFDADDDGDPDLYVANDLGSRDVLWLNEGGVLRAAPGRAWRTESFSSMGVDFSDVDGDGDTDFVTADMLSRDAERKRRQVSGFTPGGDGPGETGVRTLAGRNTLQLNRGDGTWSEVGRQAGINASEWTWGVMFADIDLDGFEDLLVTNGHAWDPLDGDTQEALRDGRLTADWRDELGVFPPLSVRNLAFRNRGDGTFAEVGRIWGFGDEENASHGIAAADLDRDGDLDAVITRLDEPAIVFRNESERPRVAIRVLPEDGGTPQAIGSRLTLRGPDGRIQLRQLTGGGMYLSGSDQLVTLAMGGAEEATVEVRWPSGTARSIEVVAGREYEIGPGAGEPASSALVSGELSRGEGTSGESLGAEPLFAPGVEVAWHTESVFVESERQPLIPTSPGRAGPGLAWGDVDQDGRIDLVMGAARGGRAQRLRNEGGTLGSPEPIGPEALGDHTSVLVLPGESEPIVIAGVNNWEANDRTAGGIQPISILAGDPDWGSPPPAPLRQGAGPIAAGDVNGDGAVDLVIGGRSAPGTWPMPAASRLLLGSASGWSEDPQLSASLQAFGVVSGVVFSDFDGDADPDVLLAPEWGPLSLFENRNGTLEEATEAWGLDDWRGRWNAVATGDFDADGRPDIVATGWGSNTGGVASPERPQGVAVGDFDGNGRVDIIEFETDEDGLRRPVRSYPSLIGAMPFIRRNVPTFESFSRASVSDLLGPDREGVMELEINTLKHAVFLNRDGSFERMELPLAAQVAPAFGVAVADYNRDGHEDIFLAQNYFATPVGIDRYDAARGLVLLGDGKGGFRVLTAAESGIVVDGDARAAAVADFDEDGRIDLAVTQNGGATVVFRGAGGSSGLRVRFPDGLRIPGTLGARLRARYADGTLGPLREVQAGGGFMSMNGSTQIFGRRAEIESIQVHWAHGSEESFDVPASATEVVVSLKGADRR